MPKFILDVTDLEPIPYHQFIDNLDRLAVACQPINGGLHNCKYLQWTKVLVRQDQYEVIKNGCVGMTLEVLGECYNLEVICSPL